MLSAKNRRSEGVCKKHIFITQQFVKNIYLSHNFFKKTKKKQYYFSFCFLFFFWTSEVCVIYNSLQLFEVNIQKYWFFYYLCLFTLNAKICIFTLEIKSTNPAYNPDLSFYSLDVFYIVPSPLLPAILSFQPSRKFDTNLLPIKCFPVDRGNCVSQFSLSLYTLTVFISSVSSGP